MATHQPLKVLEFKAPPVPKRAESKDWRGALESALKSRPGVWALVAEHTYSTKGRREYAHDPRWEMRRDYRYKDQPNRCDLYMRYVGDKALTHAQR